MPDSCQKQTLQSSCLTVYSSVTYDGAENELWCRVELKSKNMAVWKKGRMGLRKERGGGNKRIKEKVGSRSETLNPIKRNKWWHSFLRLHSLNFCPLLFLRIWRIPLFTYQMLFSWLSYKDEWQNKAEGRILQKRHSGRCQSFLVFSLSCLKASGCLATELQCCSRKWLYLKWTRGLVSDFLFIFLALHVYMCAEMDLKDLKAVGSLDFILIFSKKA